MFLVWLSHRQLLLSIFRLQPSACTSPTDPFISPVNCPPQGLHQLSRPERKAVRGLQASGAPCSLLSGLAQIRGMEEAVRGQGSWDTAAVNMSSSSYRHVEQGYLSHHSEVEEPFLGEGEEERKRKLVKTLRAKRSLKPGSRPLCPEHHGDMLPGAIPRWSPLPHLGCTAQVVIVHLFDGLEVDDPLQLCFVLVCKGSRAGLSGTEHRV